MGHFAKIDENNVVEQVIVISNDDLLDSEGNESEQVGKDFIANVLNLPGSWFKTSYNTVANTHKNGGDPYRYNYAVIGGTYDEENEAFIDPQPYPSWTLDSDFDWQPPVARPDPFEHYWDEDNQEWYISTDPTDPEQ